MMDQGLRISSDRKSLSVVSGTRSFDIDVTRAVRATLHDLSELRDIRVTEFEPRLVQPFGNAQDGSLADGFRLQLVNQEHGLFIPVEFRAEDEGFRVTVKAGWICEQMGLNRRLMSLDVLPDFLATQVGDEGFYLLPDFSGTLVRFKEHLPTVNRDRIYMHQSEWEKLSMMNCFGLKQDRQGTLAIIHKGDFFCHAVTEVNQAGRNRLYACFGLRHDPGEPIKQEDKEIVFQFTEGRADGFFDLAAAYRDYLVHERGVSPLKERAEDNPVLAYAARAMRTKIFHARKGNSLDGNSPLKVYATFEQTEQILDRMWEAGLRQAVITLVGWNLGGHDGAYPQKFPVEPALGGEEGLRKLIAKAKGMGYQIVPHDNITSMYLAAQTYDPEVLLRNEDNTPVLGGIWGGGQDSKPCPVAYFQRYGPDVTRIRDLGFEGHYYLDGQSNPLHRCHDPRHPADEEQFAISQCKLTQAHRALYGAVATEFGPAYALPFVDEICLHTPHNIAGCLGKVSEDFRRIIDRVVPFYPLAIHGLVTYRESHVHVYREEGVRKGLLRSIAIGVNPCMEIAHVNGASGDQYEDSIRDAGEGYRLAFEELANTHVEMVADFEELAPEASRIVYANGTALTVNWGETPAAGLEPLSTRIEHPDDGRDSKASASGKSNQSRAADTLTPA